MVVYDTNQDGISQNDELKTFDELNISSVNLKIITQTNINSNGNAVISTSTFTQDDKQYMAAGVDLSVNNKMTDYRVFVKCINNNRFDKTTVKIVA